LSLLCKLLLSIGLLLLLPAHAVEAVLFAIRCLRRISICMRVPRRTCICRVVSAQQASFLAAVSHLCARTAAAVALEKT
jgi:hypothetical protein